MPMAYTLKVIYERIDREMNMLEMIVSWMCH